MYLFLPLAPFVLDPYLRNWDGWQVLYIATLLLASVLFMRNRYVELRYSMLPWILWPLFLFVRTSSDAEFFSEQALIALSLACAVLWLEDQSVDFKWLRRITLLSALLVYAGQLSGVLLGDMRWNAASCFAQENAMQYINTLAVGLGFVVLVSRIESGWFWRGSTGLVIGGGVVSLFFSHAGGAQLAVLLSLAFVGLLALWHKFHWSSRGLLVLIVLACLLLGLLPWIAIQYGGWNASMNDSITSRVTIWEATWSMIGQHWFFGVGNGNYAAVIRDYWPELSQALYPFSAFPSVAHSQQFHVWAELGLVGFVWSLFLWTVPLLVSVRYYLKTGSVTTLVLSGLLMALHLIASVSEASQMFVVPVIGSWFVILFALRADNERGGRIFSFSRHWLLLLLPVCVALALDRSGQLRSRHLTARNEITGQIGFSDAEAISQALDLHGKNSPALFYSAGMLYRQGEHARALKAVDELQRISGTQWPIHTMRAEIYHAMGDDNAACQWARWPLTHSAQPQDQALRLLLQCP